MQNINQSIYFGELIETYGKLLTSHQKDILVEYFFNDMSLSEIAENYECSRQSVQDIIKRCEKKLQQFESKLNLCKIKNLLNETVKEIETGVESEMIIDKIQDIIAIGRD